MLSLVGVLEWRAATSPGALALTDHQGAQLTYAGLAAAMGPPDLSHLAEIVYGRDRQVS